MRLLGVKNVDELGKQHVRLHMCPSFFSLKSSTASELTNMFVQINTRLVETEIYDGPSGLEGCRTNCRPKL